MRAWLPTLLLLGGGGLACLLSLRAAVRSPGAFAAGWGETTVEGVGFPKTLRTRGATASLPTAPSRIASLTVTADEILTSICAPDRIAAVTHFADDPTIELGSTRAPPRAARVRGVDPEGVIALGPDLVFVAHFTLESATRILGSATIPVVRMRDAHSYDDVEANVRLVAAAIGEEPRGEALVSGMRAELARLAALTAGRTAPRVLYYSAVGYTSGTGTLVDEKIRRAGGRNAAAEADLVGFRNVSVDLLVGLDPDVVVVPRWTDDAEAPVRDVTESAAFRSTRAVRERRVFALPASALTSESPDGVVGVEQLARLLHPEVFGS